MKKLYAYTIGSLIGLMPLIFLISYLTYSEKYLLPIVFIIIIFCGVKLRKEK